MPDDEATQLSARPIRLTRWQRFWSAAGGVALVGAGGWAEIASGKDGAGTVAFVVAGSLLSVLGIVGRLPNRISGKEYSAEFEEEVRERVNDQLELIVEELPRDVREGIASQAQSELGTPRRWAWKRSGIARRERDEILQGLGPPQRLLKAAEILANLNSVLERGGHPFSLHRGSLEAIPIIQEADFAYALIYARRSGDLLPLRITVGHMGGATHSLRIDEGDWELAFKRLQDGQY